MEMKIASNKEIDRRGLYRLVFVLAWPAIIEMLLQMIVGLVDTAMVGRLGAEALAGVGLANQIMMLSTIVIGAIGTGNTALVARFIGAKDKVTAGKAAQQAINLAIGIAILVGSLLWFLGDDLLALLFRNTEPEVIALGGSYIKILALALVFNYCLMLINATLRGAGDTKTPMRITAIVNVFNISGNFLLIFGMGPFPALGVVGAAIATAFAQFIGGIIAFVQLHRTEKMVVNLWPFKIDLAIIKRILNIGIPAAIEQGSMRLGQLLYTIMIASLGTVSYAAHQVALNAESISFNPGFGFALAATTLVGQRLGAGQIKEAERSGHASSHMAMILMSLIGVVFFFFSEQIVYIFTPDPAVVELAGICLKIVALSQPALAALMVYSGGLRGAGDTRGILWITLAGFIGVRLGFTYLFAFGLNLGLVGAWIAMSVDLYFRAILMWLRFKRGQWKNLVI